MRPFIPLIAMIAVSGLAGPPAAAAGPGAELGGPPAAPAGLSLQEAIRTGLERNAMLEAARAEADADEAGARAAEAVRWPRLTGELGWRRTDNAVYVFMDKLTAGTFSVEDFQIDRLNHPDPLSHGVAALGFEVPLDASGRIRAGIDAARGAAGAARARARAAETDLATRITEAYFGLALARSAVGVAESALAGARGYERSAAARVEAESALRSDLLRAQVRRSERERDLERRRADRSLAWARLRSLLESPAGEAPELTTPLTPPERDPGLLQEWTAQALQARPEVEAARRSAEAIRAAGRAARAEIGPDLAAMARYERNTDAFDTGQGSVVAGISLRWAAFDRARSARIAAADARARAAEAGARGLEEAVRFEVESAWHDAHVADHALVAAREAAGAAEAARRITAERYAAGLLPLTDLLDIETALLSAQLAELTALHDAVVGRAHLARAAGSLEVRP